ncbi:hypothetical protein [Chryseobacterium indoltheticum]|uniref:Uncharacterized protein n=1 Tax=Chryseobacterium indoltheticum TaxID=254 RepID=A0A381FLC5_9FLAO|nr:hypothetical protein [Chryseobacterium indoltheticum]SUX47351.1 Uncharacterised protein [Chryseobacterium indoltheticum]
MNIEELLSHIEKRPQMYFRERDVYFLETFLGGFFVSEYLKDKNFKNDFRSNFYEWLQNKFNLQDNSTWADFIDLISKKENLNSVDVFFREYHLFKRKQ